MNAESIVSGIEGIRNLVELRREDLMGSVSNTNEIFIDEVMLLLGYNKKFDRGVLRDADPCFDWMINSAEEKRIAFHTHKLGDSVSGPSKFEMAKMAHACGCKVCMMNEGTTLIIINLDSKFVDITSGKYEGDVAIAKCGLHIDLFGEISQDVVVALQSISKDSFNMDVLAELISKNDESIEDVIKRFIEEEYGKFASAFIDFIDWCSDNGYNYGEEEKQTFINTLKSCLDTSGDMTSDVYSLKEENERLIGELDECHKQIEAMQKAAVNASENGVDNDNSDIEDTGRRLAELEEKTAELEKRNAELDNDLIDTREEKIDLETECNELKEKLANEKAYVEELKEKLEAAQKSSVASDSPEGNDGHTESNSSFNADGYKQKIQSLTEQIYVLTDTNKSLTEEVERLRGELTTSVDSKKKQSMELLDLIEVGENAPRSYAGVVNNELFQNDSLNKFAGAAIQRLYEIKNLEASQWIYNGDMFKLKQVEKNGDFVMNKKFYEIDLSNCVEDDVINKLRILYSHFDDIVFLCKKVGIIVGESKGDTDEEHLESTDESPEGLLDEPGLNLGIDDENPEDTDSEDDIFGMISGEDQIDEDRIVEGFTQSSDIFADFIGSEDVDEIDNDTMTGKYCIGISRDLAGTDRIVSFDYITDTSLNSRNNYVINTGENDLNNQLVKAISAVMAIACWDGKSSVVTSARHLTQISEIISTDAKDCNMIPCSRYGIEGVTSGEQAYNLLVELCEMWEINTQGIRMYVTCNVNEKDEEIPGMTPEVFDEDRIFENTELSNAGLDISESIEFVMQGKMVETVYTHPKILRILDTIGIVPIGVKTKYWMHRVMNFSEIITMIEALIQQFESSGNAFDIDNFGRTLDRRHSYISSIKDNVSEESTPSDSIIPGKTLYISDISYSEMPETWIRLFVGITRSTAIAVKTKLSKQGLGLVVDEFATSNPELSLSVASLCNYLRGIE